MIEYRVKWKREGLNPKRLKYASRKLAERRLSLLTTDKPWELFGLDPTAYACCDGHECACGGLTVRQQAEQRIAELPPIEYAKIEQREVGVWGPSP